MSEWQPIKTAPKDGTVVDLWVTYRGGGSRSPSCVWKKTPNAFPTWVSPSHGDWEYGYGRMTGVTPTHWMLPPAPPKPLEPTA